MKYILPLFFSAIASLSSAQTIPDSIRFEWNQAGFEGSIPEYTNIIDVTSFGAIANDTIDDHLAIVSAINSLNGNSGVIYFPPGNYLMNAMINLPDSIVLRGAGSDSTLLTFNFNNANSYSINISHGQSNLFLPVFSGYSKGSNQLIIVNADSLFSAGDEIEIHEVNGAWDTNPATWADFSVGHLSWIDSLSGDTIWIHEALRIDFDVSLNPEIRKIVSRKYCGLECFKMIREDGGAPSVNYGVSFNYASNCWMRGVESEKSIGAHVDIEYSSHIDISGCYFHEAYLYDGASTRGYGVMMASHSCSNLVQDNIFRMLRHAMISKQGANGNVFGYNYSREPNRSEPISDYASDMSLHGHYAFANLYEGNIAQNLQIDQAWGPSGPYNTFFRNKIELYGVIMSSGTVQSDRQNFVGNDVSNMSLFHGMYTLTGTNHFEFGNNVRGTITPNGTNNLPDTSYFLDSIPPTFWNIPTALPSVGIPNTYAMDINPAFQRYNSGGALTLCGFSHDTTIFTPSDSYKFDTFSINGYSLKKNSLVLELTSDINQDMMVELFSVSGQQIIYQLRKLKEGPNVVSMNLSSEISSGIYFIHLFNSEKTITKKIAAD